MSLFPTSLKLANVTPVHKKKERTNKENYRPISVLPTVSKVFERNMHNEIFSYIEKHLSPFLFGFRKGHNTEACLIIMIEKWRNALDKKLKAGAILTDLSKAFDCLNHRLLIAKLDAYGFSKLSLKFIYSYLYNRKQRTKVSSCFSSWKEIKTGVPQGSILGPLLFNIYMNDIFLFMPSYSMISYADDNTTFAINKDFTSLMNTLVDNTSIMLEWFKLNEMKSNTDKCQLIVANNAITQVNIGNDIIHGNTSVKLLGIIIDNELKFTKHVTSLCKKASQKLHALARISTYINSFKLRILMKSFIDSQFNYCPLIWMFHNRTLNNRINRLHERALRLVFKNPNLSFQELVNKDKSFTIHERNLQRLAIEMFKIKNKLSPSILSEVFPIQNPSYDLRSGRSWITKNIRTIYYGKETLTFRGPKTWDLLPKSLQEIGTLKEFKRRIKTWKPEGCSCRLCLIFIPNLGFI